MFYWDTIRKRRIFLKYNIVVVIEKRVNIGGVHLYDENDENLISPSDSISPIAEILFKLTNIYTKTEDEESFYLGEYSKMKETLLDLIEKTKDNKRKMFQPGPVSATHIMSRCIGNTANAIEFLELERTQKCNEMLENIEKN